MPSAAISPIRKLTPSEANGPATLAATSPPTPAATNPPASITSDQPVLAIVDSPWKANWLPKPNQAAAINNKTHATITIYPSIAAPLARNMACPLLPGKAPLSGKSRSRRHRLVSITTPATKFPALLADGRNPGEKAVGELHLMFQFR